MKFKNNLYGFISFKHIILILLLLYITWLMNLFYTSINDVYQMYSDSYDKIADEKQKITEIIKLKYENEENDYKLGID